MEISVSFSDAEVFHYQGEARAVRIWDEAMLRGETVSISTDQVAALRDPLRASHPSLVDQVARLEHALEEARVPCTFTWPDVKEDTGVNQWSAGSVSLRLLNFIISTSDQYTCLPVRRRTYARSNMRSPKNA